MEMVIWMIEIVFVGIMNRKLPVGSARKTEMTQTVAIMRVAAGVL